ncbi:MAG TPA: hypothetical protein VHI71_11505 [Actinomycetota bacterium]|nr:hypothetical protein [Actinomycetota bacterium]
MEAEWQTLAPTSSGAHRLDREVINYVVAVLADNGIVVRSVREAFSEGAPVFPGSALTRLAHVQVAVRDLSMISDVAINTKGDVE